MWYADHITPKATTVWQKLRLLSPMVGRGKWIRPLAFWKFRNFDLGPDMLYSWPGCLLIVGFCKPDCFLILKIFFIIYIC